MRRMYIPCATLVTSSYEKDVTSQEKKDVISWRQVWCNVTIGNGFDITIGVACGHSVRSLLLQLWHLWRHNRIRTWHHNRRRFDIIIEEGSDIRLGGECDINIWKGIVLLWSWFDVSLSLSDRTGFDSDITEDFIWTDYHTLTSISYNFEQHMFFKLICYPEMLWDHATHGHLFFHPMTSQLRLVRSINADVNCEHHRYVIPRFDYIFDFQVDNLVNTPVTSLISHIYTARQVQMISGNPQGGYGSS